MNTPTSLKSSQDSNTLFEHTTRPFQETQLDRSGAMDDKKAAAAQATSVSAALFSTILGNTGLHYQSLYECLGSAGGNRTSFLPLLKENAKVKDFLSGESQFKRLVKKERQIHDFSSSFCRVLERIQSSQAHFSRQLQETKIKIYEEDHFSISIKKSDSGVEFILESKQGLLSSKKIFYRVSGFDDVAFSKLVENFKDYSEEFLPEAKYFLSSKDMKASSATKATPLKSASTSNRAPQKAKIFMFFGGTGNPENREDWLDDSSVQRFFPGPGGEEEACCFSGCYLGNGMERQFKGIKKDIERILSKKIETSPEGEPLLINLEGASRGCYNAVAAAHFLQNPHQELSKKLQEKQITLDIQLTLLDPVKGPKHNELLTKDSIPPVVSRLNIIYSKLALYKVFDKGIFMIEDPSRTSVSISLHDKTPKEERTLGRDHCHASGHPTIELRGKYFKARAFNREEVRASEELEKIDLLKPFSKTTQNQAVINYLARRAEELRVRMAEDGIKRDS